MIRKAFVMTIFPGQEEEYKKRHNPIWPELEAEIKRAGVHNYSIYRHGLTLFAYCEIEDEARWNALANTDIVKKWWAHMAPIMASNPDNSPVAVELDEAFHLA